MKTALQYQQMLDEGQAQSQADLARLLGVSRAKITQVMNLLKLDEEIHVDQNWGIALLEGCFAITAVIILQSI